MNADDCGQDNRSVIEHQHSCVYAVSDPSSASEETNDHTQKPGRVDCALGTTDQPQQLALGESGKRTFAPLRHVMLSLLLALRAAPTCKKADLAPPQITKVR